MKNTVLNGLKQSIHLLKQKTPWLFRFFGGKRKSKRALAIAWTLLVLLILQIILLVVIKPGKVEAAWANDSYAYRQLITFTHNAALTNQSIQLTISNTNTLVTNGKMQSDCDDTRFTDGSGLALRFKLVSGCNSVTTTYDVIFPTVINGANYGYVYYGNPSAVSASDSTVLTGITPSAGAPAVANEEKGPTPVLSWSFDEGYGTSIHDTSSNSNTGILAASSGSGGSPVNIDDASDFGAMAGAGRQLVRTSAGTLYAFINDGGSCEIWKSANGTTWAEQDSANNPACPATPNGEAMAIDSTGTLHLIYTINTTLSLRYQTFSTVTDTFSGSEETIATAAGNFAHMSIAIDSNDVPHIAYYSNTGSFLVLYNNRVGGTWGATTLDTLGSTTSPSTSIAINEDDIPEVSWIHANAADLTAAVGNVNDASSFTVTDIDTNINVTANQMGDSIAIDSSGNTWVAYTDVTTNFVTLIKHNDADAWATWQTPVTNSNVGYEPSLAIDGTTVKVFYENATTDIAYDTYTGTWAGEVIMETSASNYKDVKVRWSYINNFDSTGVAPVQTNTYYIDGSDAAATDPNSAWSTDANGFDGSLSTSASTTTNGDLINNFLKAEGTNAPASGGTITSVKTRVYGNSTDTVNGGIGIEIFTDGLAEDLGGASRDGAVSPGWSDYSPLSAPTGGWTWAKIQALEAKVYQVRLSAATGTVYKLEILVQSTNAAAQTQFDYVFSDGTDVFWDNTSAGGSGTVPTWQTDDLCYSGKCLKFSAGVVSKTYASDTELDPGTANLTVSAWFRHPNTISSQENIVSRFSSGGYRIYMSATGTVCFAIDDDGTGFPSDSTCSSASYNDSKWHHVEAVKNGTTSITLYIDGIVVGTPDTSITANAIGGSSPTFVVGADSNTSSNPWNGSIDEVKVFNDQTARTALQVKADFISKGLANGASAVFGTNDISTALSQGLVGYWKMDESSGLTRNCTAAPFTDSSGNAINGKSCPSTTGPDGGAAGKFGKAVTFDGGGDYIDVTSSNLSFGAGASFTVSGWFKTSVTGTRQGIYGIDSDNGQYIAIFVYTDNAIQMETNDSNGSYLGVGSGGTTVTDGTWHHYVATRNASARTLSFYLDGKMTESTADTRTGNFSTTANYIGRDQSSFYMNGSIDETRIYNRALSSREVASLSDWAPGPVGYWDMNENSNITINDKSGNGNTGTLTNTPTWVSGKFGSGVNFKSGSTQYINAGSAAILDDITVKTAAAWVYPRSRHSSNPWRIFNKEDTGTWYVAVAGGQNSIEFQQNFTVQEGVWDTPDGSLILNKWNYITVTYDRSSSSNVPSIYINGVKQTLTTVTAPSGSAQSDGPASLLIGNGVSPFNRTFDGIIDEAKIYNYARTAKQIVSDMNAGHPNVGSPVSSPVGYWKFDEGYSTTAHDNTPSANDLTLSTATLAWTNQGKFGKAWNGLGTNWLTRSDDDDFDFAAADDMSISLWYKTDAAGNPANNEYLLEKGTITNTGTAGYALYANSSGNIVYGIKDDAAWGASSPNTLTPDDTATSPTDLYDNTWHHVVATKTGSSRIDLYVDGKLTASDTSLAATSTLANAIALRVGDDDADSTNAFNGDIDELKIYRYALNADEVKVDYNQGKAQVMGSLSTNADGFTASNSAARAYCPPGNAEGNCAAGSDPSPVGEWNFDENTGTTVNDTSGRGNTSSAFTGNVKWVPGKFGSATLFDGVDDVVRIPETSSTDLGATSDSYTASVWFKTISVSGSPTILGKDDGSGAYPFQISLSAGPVIRFRISDGTITPQAFAVATPYLDNKWHNAVGIRDVTNDRLDLYIDGVLVGTVNDTTTATAVNNDDISIGSSGTSYISQDLSGSIDSAGIYNYIRTPAQIAWNYNKGKPVAWWKFDECSGTTAHDVLNNGYDGTLNVAAGSNTAVGTCGSNNAAHMWNDGNYGKFNTALGFDGSDDYVATGNIAPIAATTLTYQAVSWGGWMVASSSAASKTIIHKAKEFKLTTDASSKAVCSVDISAGVGFSATTAISNTAVPVGSWTQLICTYDGTNVRIYMNGRLETTSSTVSGSITSTSTASAVNIGRDPAPSGFFEGLIDEVQLYNYTLTLPQIKNLYNGGASVSF